MSSILSARGQTWVELGGERCWAQRVKGDIVVSFQWLEAGEREPSPCMVMFPTTMKLDGGAYAIPQANAHEYADNKGNPTHHLMVSAHNAAISMGFFPDKSTVFRIVDIIIENLPDLIRMPSEQPASLEIKAPTIGIEAGVRVGGNLIHQEVV